MERRDLIDLFEGKPNEYRMVVSDGGPVEHADDCRWRRRTSLSQSYNYCPMCGTELDP